MTRKDLETRFHIFGKNNDISLYRNNGSRYEYFGNIKLERGKAVFEGRAYTDIDELYKAVDEWGKNLPYPVDTYNPMLNEAYRTESRLSWYLTEKMGFKAGYEKEGLGWGYLYTRDMGLVTKLQVSIRQDRFNHENEIEISSKVGPYTFMRNVSNAEDGIGVLSSIIESSILSMASDMVEALAVCPKEKVSEINALVPSNKNIFGVEVVSFKDLMIERLENQLKALKGE
jgi:hypothetical protein